MGDKHRHAAVASLTRHVAYTGGVAREPGRQNPRAAGGITTVETCRCGHVRKINSNGRAVEYGPWEKA